MSDPGPSPPASFWVFGYGSIMWRPDIPHTRAEPALLAGWARRFWQGSEDHRGVPGAPGRVVTLVPDAHGSTWGMVYEVPRLAHARVMTYLDHREQGGYTRTQVVVRPRSPGLGPLSCTAYVGDATNPHYLGPAPLPEMAAQIVAARGPSGRNIDYLRALRDALRDLHLPDPHIESLSAAAGIE
jgi:glutathione-specific gamma-glutamylcyclotransferase